MILCPECGFENPDASRFCRVCGAELQLHAPSSDNGARADSSADRPASPVAPLPQLAIIFVQPDSLTDCDPRDGSTPAPSKLTQATMDHWLQRQGPCLAGRYQMLSTPSPRVADWPRQTRHDMGQATVNDTVQSVELTVIDTQPQTPTLTNSMSEPDIDEQAADKLEALLAALPKLARIHLLLQDELYPSCPQVYDAWSDEGYTAIVLESRDPMPLLSATVNDAIADDAIVDEQILHWLYDTVQLWELLAAYRCHQSLLELDNLRVDDDQILCLRRLYPDLPDRTYPVSCLGRLWRRVFGQCLGKLPEVQDLCNVLETDGISTVEQVKQRLEITRIGRDRTSSPEVESGPSPSDRSSPESEQVSDYAFDEGDDLPTVVLPMQLYSLSDAGQTDVGRMRRHNEDCFYMQTDVQKRDSPDGRICNAKGLYILCDGMGGHASGEVASRIAVETLRSYFQSWTNQLPMESSLNTALQRANQAIYEQNQTKEAYGNGRMGTTVVMLLVQGLQVAIAHVGDSRLYRVTRKHGLEQLTVDHEVGQREIHRGVSPDIAYSRQDAYQLTQALGPRGQEFIRPDIQYLPITEDALFILASDGLTDNNLLERHYDTHVEPLLSSQTNIEQGVANLIGLANHHNGHDNITAIAVRVKLRPILQSQEL